MSGVKQSSSAKHWNSARDLVGSELPTSDDVSTTLSGEPLDTAEKVRDFLSSVNATRKV